MPARTEIRNVVESNKQQDRNKAKIDLKVVAGIKNIILGFVLVYKKQSAK